MRAAVIRRAGATPAVDQLADPQPGHGPVGGHPGRGGLESARCRDRERPVPASPAPALHRWLRGGRAARRRHALLPGRAARCRTRRRWPSWCQSRGAGSGWQGLEPASPPWGGQGWSDGWRSTSTVTSSLVGRCWSWGGRARRACWQSADPPGSSGARAGHPGRPPERLSDRPLTAGQRGVDLAMTRPWTLAWPPQRQQRGRRFR